MCFYMCKQSVCFYICFIFVYKHGIVIANIKHVLSTWHCSVYMDNDMHTPELEWRSNHDNAYLQNAECIEHKIDF